MGLLDVLKSIPRNIPNPLDPIGSIIGQVVQTNIATTERINIPAKWSEKVVEYSKDNPVDGVLLLLGLSRPPVFYKRGGWVLQLQPDAGTITLDTDIFCKNDISQDVDGVYAYVQELTHVAQNGLVGRARFLTSYFGLRAVTIAARFITRLPLSVIKSSPHETQAYDIQGRFLT